MIFPEGTTGDGTSVLPFHANLIQAAISAPAPVQPVALRYVDRHGDTSQAASYIGDESLVGSIWRLLSSDGMAAVVRFGVPDQARGRDRRNWARELREEVDRLRQHTRGAVV
jgi:1-acyl-sn-glycerol-3-phosphate acyltransferase